MAKKVHNTGTRGGKATRDGGVGMGGARESAPVRFDPYDFIRTPARRPLLNTDRLLLRDMVLRTFKPKG
jgi:hypothetical protein